MDLWSFMKVLFRRWYLTVPLLALTAFGAVHAAGGVAPTYTASSSGVFLQPPINLPKDQIATNPWVTAGLDTTAVAVVDSIQNPAAQSAVVSAGFSGEYTIQLAARSVLFTVYAPAPTRTEATATLDHVVQLMQQDLKVKQDQYKVPADQQVLIQMTSAPSLVTTRNGLQRVIVAIAGIGLVVTFVLAISLDAFLTRRARRRRAVADEQDDDLEVDVADGADDDDTDEVDHRWSPRRGGTAAPWSEPATESTTSVRPRRTT